MEKIYDVNYFIKKFEAIPEDKWIVGSLFSGDKMCAAGHCGVRANDNFECLENKEALSLIDLLLTVTITQISDIRYYSIIFKTVALVNDGDCKEYQQPTPKQRILAALYDIKKMIEVQNPERSDATDDEKNYQSPLNTIEFPSYHKPVDEVLDVMEQLTNK